MISVEMSANRDMGSLSLVLLLLAGIDSCIVVVAKKSWQCSLQVRVVARLGEMLLRECSN